MLQAPVSFRVAGPAVAHLLRTPGPPRRRGGPGAVRGEHLPRARRRPVPRHRGLRRLRPRGERGRRPPGAAAPRRGGHRAAAPDARPAGSPGSPRSCRRSRDGRPGMVVLHKRAVGLVHEARRRSAPASLGATETSLGQEDVQSFALEATVAPPTTRPGAARRDRVRAGRRAPGLDARRRDVPTGSETPANGVAQRFRGPPREDGRPATRPRGRRCSRHVLGVGWAQTVLDADRETPSQPPHPAS